jgi:hypothetical protein
MPTYCTRDQVKDRLSVPTANTASDEIIDGVIEAVSRAIDEACSTQFFAVTQTRYFTAQYWCELYVDDLLSITTLKTDADGDGTFEFTWSASDYRLAPYNAPLLSTPRPYWKIEQRIGGNFIFPVWITRGVEIAGSWGFCDIAAKPKLVEVVALRESVHHVHAIRSPYASGGPGSNEQTAVPPIGLSKNSLALLSPFRRVNVG